MFSVTFFGIFKWQERFDTERDAYARVDVIVREKPYLDWTIDGPDGRIASSRPD